MGKVVRFEWNYKQAGRLLKSDRVKEAVKGQAEKHAKGWDTDTRYMGQRVIASIYTRDADLINEELDNHSIVRSLRP